MSCVIMSLSYEAKAQDECMGDAFLSLLGIITTPLSAK